MVGQEQVHPTFVLAKEALAVCGDVKNTKVVGLHSHGLVPTPATNGKTDAGSAQMPKTNLKFNIEVFTMKKILLVLVCMVTMISLQAQNFNRSITVTDMLGTIVGQFETGSATGEYVWNCTDVKPGIYYYTIVCDGMTQTGKLVITK